MLSETIKRKVLPYGKFVEPYSFHGKLFEFFAYLESSLVHTTLFMKDYEIKSFLYIFGKKYEKPLNLKDLQEEWENFLKLSRKLLKTPEDHYLSSFILLLEAKKTEKEVEKFVKSSFVSKSIWFGLKGSYNVGIALLSEREAIYPKELESYISWLLQTP